MKTPRMYPLLFLFLAAPAVALLVEMKEAPQWIAVGLFGLHALLGRRRAPLSGPLLGALALVDGLALGVTGALWLWPALTPEGHPVMPVGQVFVGGLLGLLGAAAFLFFYLRSAARERRMEGYLLDAIGAALLLALLLDRLA
jgi:hypothetical protein